MEKIIKNYEEARDRFAELGVNTGVALEILQKISISIHCWQADDVTGFENTGDALSGGIQVTGNYPGKARNMDELRSDILKAMSMIPGRHRLSLHEIYGDFKGIKVDRNQVEPHHFKDWMDWSKANQISLDFNSTSFSHPKSGNLSLANPDKEIRNFWIDHTKRCRAISEEMGKHQGNPCMMNLWVHDGSKEVPANRLRYREILKNSLDEIFFGSIPTHERQHRSQVIWYRAGKLHRGFLRFLFGLWCKKQQDCNARHGSFPPD